MLLERKQALNNVQLEERGSESLGKKVAKMELIILIPLGMIQLILNTNQNHHWASASLKIVSDH